MRHVAVVWAGSVDYEYDENCPELCECSTPNVEGSKKRATVQFVKKLRERTWAMLQSWNPKDLDRMVLSGDALPEQLQDFETHVVVVGFDVNALYPSLDIGVVKDVVHDAIMESITYQPPLLNNLFSSKRC